MAETEAIQEYPPFVATPAQRKRWDAAKGIAEALFGDFGAEAVWGAVRAIYNSDLPTE